MTLYDFTMFSGFRLCAADQCDKLQLWDMHSNYIQLRNQSRSVMFLLTKTKPKHNVRHTFPNLSHPPERKLEYHS